MNYNTQYDIGINLLINPDSIEIFEKFSRLVTVLDGRVNNLEKTFSAFNITLENSSKILSAMSKEMWAFSASANSGMGTAALKANEFKRATSGSIFGHGSHEMAQDIRRSTGLLGSFGLGAIHEGGLAAMGAVFLGVKGFEANEEYQKKLSQIAAQGQGATPLSIQNQAFSGKLPLVSPQEYLQAYNTGLIVTKNVRSAEELTPTMASMYSANKILAANVGRQFTENDQYYLDRASEIMAHSRNPQKIANMLNLIEKAESMEGFRIPAYDIFNYARRNAALSGIESPSAFLASIVGLQQVGGSNYGTMMRTFTSSMIRGQNFITGRASLEEQRRIGIRKGMTVKDISLLSKNPSEWMMQVLEPALLKAGYRTEATQIPELYKLFPGTMANAAALNIGNMLKIEAALESSKKSYGISKASAVAQYLPQGATASVAVAWEKFATILGKLVSPYIIAGLNSLTSALNILSSVIGKVNPKNVKSDFEQIFAPSLSLLDKIAPHTSLKTDLKNINAAIYLDGKTIGNGIVSFFNKSINTPQPISNHVATSHSLPSPGNNFTLGAIR